MVTLSEIQKLIKPRNENAEKRDFGNLLLIGGSYGMMGSIAFSARAAVRSGAGLVTILAPSCGHTPLQTIVPEAMVMDTCDLRHLEQLPDIARFTAIGAGPGLGKNKNTVSFVDSLLQLKRSVVLDADALNVISENNWQSKIPEGSILTPHIREFQRLFGDKDLFKTQENKSAELGIYIVLKGNKTRMVSPNKEIYFNSTGNPGMAKGGSGDVLTGIISGLWARYNDPGIGIKLGVYLHGLAGDIAASKYHQESMNASDIIDCIPEAFKQIYKDTPNS